MESDSKVVKDLLWGRRFVKSAPGTSEDASNASHDSKDVNHPPPEQESEPLAVILVNTMFHLLFLPDFTIEDPNLEFSENDVNSPEFKKAIMWAPGVGEYRFCEFYMYLINYFIRLN